MTTLELYEFLKNNGSQSNDYFIVEAAENKVQVYSFDLCCGEEYLLDTDVEYILDDWSSEELQDLIGFLS